MKFAFGTVACPHWTHERVASFVRESGYDGVELRTFLDTPERIVCEPALTGGRKLREMFADAGAAVSSLATSVSFDEAILPPVIGRAVIDTEKSVRACQRAVTLADDIGIPTVRVFGFAVPKFDNRTRTVRRIGQRARLAVDRADKRGVRIAFENGGDFQTASDVAELIQATGTHPLVGACYAPAVGAGGGDDVAAAIDTLGSKLWMVRLTDSKNNTPCALGDGDAGVEESVRTLAESGFNGWVVFDWPRVWMPELGEPEDVLRRSAERLHEWLGASHSASRENDATREAVSA